MRAGLYELWEGYRETVRMTTGDIFVRCTWKRLFIVEKQMMIVALIAEL